MEHDVGDGTRISEPILRTKLHPPQLDAELVNRARLVEAIDRAGEVPLTLVSAPAGYGKSVLLAQWVELLSSPVAWLSLDASDSQLRAFLRYLVAAVNTVSLGACNATRELLTAGSLAPMPILAANLLNDLEAMDEPCSIVLDDYHRIDPLSPVQDLMVRILEHPPARVRFVLATRQDPPFDLLSLRAAHRINEVRLRDLRFSGEETSEFLSATADVSLGGEALTQLEREVEGWAVGLRLVSLALRNVGDADAFLKRLPGRVPEIQEYLLREVLAAQAAEVRERLLASSLLDRFCAEVLDAICEPPGTQDQTSLSGAVFLEEMRQNNLFVVSLDSQAKWFRYHHLFQELLVGERERRRDPDHVVALNLRASRWFESEGLIEEALKYALAARDTNQAAEIVARHRHSALDANEWFTLENWLSMIPDTVVQQRAELLLASAWIHLNYLLRIESLPALLEQAESLLGDEPGDEELLGELALCRGYVLWLEGDGAGSLQEMEGALEKIPVTHVELRSNAEIILAVSCQMVGQRERALRFLNAELARSDPAREVRRRARLLYAQVYVNLAAAELPAAELAQRRLRYLVERSGLPFECAWTDYMQGLLHLNRCEWEAAVEYLARAVERRFIYHRRAAVDSLLGLMLGYQALGKNEEVAKAMRLLRDFVASEGDSAMDVLVTSAEARVGVLQGRPGPARRWLAASDPPGEGFLYLWMDMPSISHCQAKVAVGSDADVEQAEAELMDFARVIERYSNKIQLVRTLAVLAIARQRLGKRGEALRALEQAVTMARKGNLFLPFVELGTSMVQLLRQLPSESRFATRVERLVDTFGKPQARPAREAEVENSQIQQAAAIGNLEGLTNRELDVLELLSRRLQNKEIAARLGISSHTVNSHLKQLYQKLGVHGRREAVEQAVAVGVLERNPLD